MKRRMGLRCLTLATLQIVLTTSVFLIVNYVLPTDVNNRIIWRGFFTVFAYGPRRCDSDSVNITPEKLDSNLIDSLQPPSDGIPRIIHQMWKTHYIPKRLSPWLRSMNKNHPNWLYVFWTDKSLQAFIKSEFPEYAKLYRNYKHNIYRADAARYFILYTFGGVYADLDVESLRPFDDIMANHSCIFSQEPVEHAVFVWKKPSSFPCNGLMASRAGHPLFKMIQSRLPDTYSTSAGVVKSTGPLMASNAIKRYLSSFEENGKYLSPRNQVFLAPSHTFMPTFDPGRQKVFKSKCKTLVTNPGDPSLLNWVNKYTTPSDVLAKQRDVCDNLAKKNYTSKPTPGAYTNHHWMHTYGANNVDLYPGCKGNETDFIGDVIPNFLDGQNFYSMFKRLKEPF